MPKGSFYPNCVTSDGSTFYAHAVVYIGSTTPERTIVIAKSNTNPASFNDVTWSVYATVSEDYMGYLGGINRKSMLCIMDKQGVFTIIATSTKTSSDSQETLGMGGYQYTPHADPSTGGTWTTIHMRTPYPWSTFGGGGLVLVPRAAGDKDVLMHVFPTSSSGNAIGVGVFDPVLKTFSLQSNWTMPSPGLPDIIEPRGGQMHVLTFNVIGAKDPVLNRMSISPTAAPPANSSIATSNFTRPDGCTSVAYDPQTCLFANYFYYMCRHTSSNANYLVSTDGTNKIGPVKTSVFNSYSGIYPIGPAEGPALWGMMANATDYAGVVLSGDKIGELQTLSSKMSISGLPGSGDVLDGGDSGGGDGGGGGDSGGLSPGVVAAIVGGIFLLIMSISSLCRICTKRSKRHLGSSRPTTPVYEDPDSLVPNITDVPEAKMECEALPMAPITAAPPVPLGTGDAGVGPGKDTGSSMLPPPLLAPRPYTDTNVSQAAHHQQHPPPSQSPQTQNTFEDGYQQGFQQALLALRKEQEQQQQQQELLRQTQNPQLLVTSVSPQSVPGTWPPTNSNTTTTTLASNNPQYNSQPQGNNSQYYSLPIPGSVGYQQHQQQQSQGYYQTGISTDDARNPQAYNAGGAPLSPVVPGSTLLSPLPAYVSGSVSMSSPAPPYGTGGGSGRTPYTPSSGTSQDWTPGSTAYTSPVVPGSTHHPGAQGHNPSYHQ